MTDKTIRELQTSLPWTIRYSRDYRANPQPHKDFTHALLHVVKAVGKLQGLADDMDHDREIADNPKLRDEYGKYVADLVVCALRAANVFPGGVLDLQKAVQERITTKNSHTKPVWVPMEPNSPVADMKREPITADSFHYEALDESGNRLGTFWSPKLCALQACACLYPTAFQLKVIA